ncbi:Pyroglutamylated RFamide peptide receptor [Stylophora pistillata]|uniref:Pyroglutamylated RFamide peptide receptor n=2 Tax=Stylophora pistillata TaxID=50429 RepID=A0A2B4RHY9_STYPI|nr:Pyroglutamylated RFamide peptide receptor [Stylophora pistillata]
MNYLLVNLAFADILVALFIAPQFVLIHTFQHPDGILGRFLCKFLTGGNFMWTGATASAFSLVVIAFERYFAVMHPYNNTGKLTHRKLKIIIPVLWISALILNTPLFLTSYFDKENEFCMEYWPKKWMPKAFSVAWFVLLGVLPMLVMTGLYSRVVYALWIKNEERVNGTQQGVMRVRKRVTKMVVAVSIIYGLCWTPDLVIYAMIHFGSKHNLGDAADVISIVLVVCNSTVNPFIYAYVNSRFRRHIKALLCCYGSGTDSNRVHAMGRGNETSRTNSGINASTIQGEIQSLSHRDVTLFHVSRTDN